MSGTKRRRLVVALVLAGAVLSADGHVLVAEVERWASAKAHTLSGTRDIVMLKRYAEHFGDALREQYSGVSLIVAGDGEIEQAFTSPTRRETRLYLNKLIPENPFVWEERPLESAVDAAELYLYRPDGTPVTGHTSAVVFPMMSYEAGVQKYEKYLDGREDVEAVVQLDLSPFAVRYPTVIHLAAEGR